MIIYVYAIKSLIKEYVYIGHTKDLKRRIKEHNTRAGKANSNARPFKIFYYEIIKTRQEAVKREKHLKSGFNREILRSIAYKNGEVPKWLKGRVC